MGAVLKTIFKCSLIFSCLLILPKVKFDDLPGISLSNVKAGGEAGSFSYKTIWEDVKANLR